MSDQELGIGSRVRHPEFGEGGRLGLVLEEGVVQHLRVGVVSVHHTMSSFICSTCG